MARKVVNRKALREEVEAAEKAGVTKAPKKKTPTKKRPSKARSKDVAPQRKKIFWGVFTEGLRRVATFEFDQKKAAEKKAKELSQGGKSPHFVQKIKEAIE